MLRARFRRWLHCLLGTFSGHRAVTMRYHTGFTLECTCGRVFAAGAWRTRGQ